MNYSSEFCIIFEPVMVDITHNIDLNEFYLKIKRVISYIIPILEHNEEISNNLQCGRGHFTEVNPCLSCVDVLLIITELTSEECLKILQNVNLQKSQYLSNYPIKIDDFDLFSSFKQIMQSLSSLSIIRGRVKTNNNCIEDDFFRLEESTLIFENSLLILNELEQIKKYFSKLIFKLEVIDRYNK